MTPNEVVASNVSDLRRGYGLTQRDLVDAMADRAGVKMDPATMARLEGGGRRITVEDVFAIAVALEVSPLDLLLPRQPRGELEVGTVRAAFREVRAWLRRRDALPGSDVGRFAGAELPDVKLDADLEDAEARMREAHARLDYLDRELELLAKRGADDAELEHLRQQRNDYLDAAVEVASTWRDLRARYDETGW